MIKAQRGTIDIMPTEVLKWQYIENNAREVCRLHNVSEIRTPIFEATELFSRSSGESSDIVNKEMYTFLDKGERSITLKPEGTAGVVRACIEHGLFADALPVKLYYISPAFRYEKPQAGRLREFRQFGVELFGSKTPKMVAEAVQLGTDFLKAIGLKNVKVKINNLGCPECRKTYVEKLKEYFESHKEDLCEDCKRRLIQNPLRILDCKVEKCKELKLSAPKVSDYLCDDCKNYTKSLMSILSSSGVDFVVDDSIIRGLDYYTGIVFEFETEDIEGSSAVIGGGGQYNNLVEELGGQSIPAVGFAFGMERLLMLLDVQNTVKVDGGKLDVLVISMDENFASYEQKILSELRKNKISADADLMNRSFRANFKYANKLECKYVVVLGEDEVKQNKVALKNMLTGEQKLVDIEKLVDEVK
ncbi:MAG: histidine--tRNA ligase [Clostridiales bacterium]|nr:histidine--tRNA ligase [Candidatus Apopatousia equi]